MFASEAARSGAGMLAVAAAARAPAVTPSAAESA